MEIGTMVIVFIIIIIGSLIYIILFSDKMQDAILGTKWPKENCLYCGRPFELSYRFYLQKGKIDHTPDFDCFCLVCIKKYSKLIEEEMRKHRGKKIKCNFCNGGGKIKGYQCVKCRGQGKTSISENFIEHAAKKAVASCNPVFRIGNE